MTIKHAFYKRQPLRQIVLGKLDIHMQKIETRSQSLTCARINSKWIRYLNVKLKMGNYYWKILEDIDIGNNFLNKTLMG
jgi:hypothetical protein